MLKEALKKLVERTGYTLVRTDALRDAQRQRPITRDDFFELCFSRVNPDGFFFVQVGANDGKTNDPLYAHVTKRGLSGLAVEPQPDVFELLRKNYAPYPGVRCVQAAVAAHTGTLPFYTVRDSVKTRENFSRVTGIASFDEAVFRKTVRAKLPLGADVDAFIQATPVEALSFRDLFGRHGVTRVDLLQLDCEGYDYEILKTFDFGRYAPGVINLESLHFSDAVRDECEAFLAAHGYRSFRTRADICAYRA